jgi:hypothetical protein
MPRKPAPVVPRWKRGKQKSLPSMPVTLKGRHAKALTRELVKAGQQPAGKGRKEGTATVLARSGAWRFRRHLPPFLLLAGLIAAGAILPRTAHPLLYGNLAGLAAPVVMVLFTRHLSKYARGTAEAWAAFTALWLPAFGLAGFSKPVPGLLVLTWAPPAALWVRHYRWRPAAAPIVPDASDYERWNALAAERKWNGQLGTAEQLPGGGRRYPVQLDGIKTVIRNVLSASENVAGAWHKPMTEAYAERDPVGITSRGYLTILGRETLMTVREWNGAGIDPQTGMAVAGRFADGSPVHVKFYTPRYGTRHALISGTTGSGKSELLNLLIFTALMSGTFVPIVLDPQEGQSLPFWRDRCLYAAGLDACHSMLRGLHAGMLDRSRYLASLRWDDDGIPMRGMPFFDHDLTGLRMPLIIFDEAHMALKGRSKAEAQVVEKTTEIGRLGRKTGTGLWLATHVPSLAELGGEQALRDMLRGGNVISMRTANKVATGMLGLQKDPSEIPSFFTDGKETYGLGYAAGPDNRPDAPMRSDLVPKSMRRKVPVVPRLDDRFLEAMDAAMGAEGVLLAPAAAEVPADDAPEGRRCIDAVWQVLADSGREMERGEIIKWVNGLAQTGWGRDKPFTIRAIGDACTKLAEGKVPGREVTKPRGGVYRAVTDSRLST